MGYYQSSGKVSAGRIPLGLLAGIILSIPLAFLYVWLGHLIHFIIVKAVLLTAALFALLEIVKLSNRISLNRNRSVTYFYILINSVILLIFSWVFFVVFELGRGFSDAILHLPKYVQLVFGFQEYHVTSPLSWVTKSPGPSVSGWEIYAVLGGEAFLLLFGAFIAIRTDHFDRMLFCESCNRWITKKKVIKKEYNRIFTRGQLEEMLRQGDLSELTALPNAPQNSKRFYEIRLYSCGSCETSRYLQIKKHDYSFSRRDKDKFEVLVDYYLLDDRLISSID